MSYPVAAERPMVAVFTSKNGEDVIKPILFWTLDQETGEYHGLVLALDEKSLAKASEVAEFVQYAPEEDFSDEECPHCGKSLDEDPDEVPTVPEKINGKTQKQLGKAKADFSDL